MWTKHSDAVIGGACKGGYVCRAGYGLQVDDPYDLDFDDKKNSDEIVKEIKSINENHDLRNRWVRLCYAGGVYAGGVDFESAKKGYLERWMRRYLESKSWKTRK